MEKQNPRQLGLCSRQASKNSLCAQHCACGFNVLFKLIPFFIIGDVINRLINSEKGLKTYLIEIAMIAGSFVIAEIFHSVSTAFSHKATFSVLGQIRKKTCDKLSRVPLGYVKDTSSGTLKKLWRSGLTA